MNTKSISLLAVCGLVIVAVAARRRTNEATAGLGSSPATVTESGRRSSAPARLKVAPGVTPVVGVPNFRVPPPSNEVRSSDVLDTDVTDPDVRRREKILFSTREWEGKITDRRKNERIAWKTTSGTQHSGIVSFHKIGDNLTRVMVTVDFHPTGILEKMASGLRFAKRAVEADLARFKTYVEMQDAKALEYGNDKGDDDGDDDQKNGSSKSSSDREQEREQRAERRKQRQA